MSMADKEMVSDWGVHLSRHLQILAVSFPDPFPPDWCGRTEEGSFFMVGLPK